MQRKKEARQPSEAVLDQFVAQAAEAAEVTLTAGADQRLDQGQVVPRVFDAVVNLEGPV